MNIAIVNRYPKGVLPDSYTPGDFGLVRDWHEDMLGTLIQAEERSEAGDTGWANITHSFAILTAGGDISEANAGGIQRGNVEKYRQCDLYIVSPVATKTQRALCTARWRAQIGVPYDKWDFVGLGLNRLLGWGLSLHSADKRFICSEYVAYGLLAFEVDFAWTLETITPLRLALHYGLVAEEQLEPLNLFGRFLNMLVMAGQLVRGVF